MNANRKTDIVVVVIALALVSFSSTALAATREVCSSGCAYTTIQGAVDAAAPGDTIMVLDSVHTEGGIEIGTDLTLAGDPATRPILQASPTPGVAVDRVLDILPNADVTVQDLIIRHGHPTATSAGGIANSGELRLVRTDVVSNDANGWNGGGILSTGALELVDSLVFGNVADFFGAGISCVAPCTISMLRSTIDGNVLQTPSGPSDGGAGLYLSGSGVIEASQISNNVCTGGSVEGTGGGVKHTAGELLLIDTDVFGNQAGRAGGISSNGPLTVIRGSISNNTATDTYTGAGGLSAAGDPTIIESTVISGNTGRTGAGVQTASPDFAIRRSAIVDNHSTSAGGGLTMTSGGPAVIEDCLIAGNTSYRGGGVYVDHAGMSIRNSTISGNTADLSGGGVFVAPSGDVSLSNVTVTDNTADPGGLSGVNGGGIYIYDDGGFAGYAEVRNSIIADNRDFSPTIFAQAANCAGPLTVDGWLSLGGTGLSGLDPACILSGATPDIGGDQGLLPLADNGGPTMTHALTIGSQNVDTGDPTGCKDGLGSALDADQRGGTRVATCDRGAFERGTDAPFFVDDFETGGLWLWSGSSD